MAREPGCFGYGLVSVAIAVGEDFAIGDFSGGSLGWREADVITVDSTNYAPGVVAVEFQPSGQEALQLLLWNALVWSSTVGVPT